MFEILLAIKRGQPHVKQKDISETLGVTIQAVSKYFKKLKKEGYLETGSERADYRLTQKAISGIQSDLKSLERYIISIKGEMKFERSMPAIATRQVKTGDEVGLVMKGGVIYTVAQDGSEAKGTAMEDASPGEDLELKNLQGKLKVKEGRILIVKLPSIRNGGSRVVDLDKIKEFYDEFKPDRVGVMGAVGRAVLNKLGLKADIEFGISRAAAIAASRGLNVLVLVVGRMANRMTEEIENLNMKSATNICYEIRDSKSI
jgi:putative transcriptional regulator